MVAMTILKLDEATSHVNRKPEMENLFEREKVLISKYYFHIHIAQTINLQKDVIIGHIYITPDVGLSCMYC